jgi:hypothetical protein
VSVHPPTTRTFPSSCAAVVRHAAELHSHPSRRPMRCHVTATSVMNSMAGGGTGVRALTLDVLRTALRFSTLLDAAFLPLRVASSFAALTPSACAGSTGGGAAVSRVTRLGATAAHAGAALTCAARSNHVHSIAAHPADAPPVSLNSSWCTVGSATAATTKPCGMHTSFITPCACTWHSPAQCPPGKMQKERRCERVDGRA